MLTLEQALAKAKTLTTEAEFLSLVNETSAHTSGNKTALYGSAW